MDDDTSNIPAGPSEEVLREATSQGWVPKEKFNRDEREWVDAETFVKRGREILPILRKNNEHLVKDLEAAKKQLNEFRETAEEFKKFQKQAHERQVAEYEKTIADLKASKAQAISDGDGIKAAQLDDQLDEAKEVLSEAKIAAKEAAKETPPADETPANKVDPSLELWLKNNTWFGTERRLTGIANGIAEQLRLERPNLKGQEFLEELDKILVEEMPDKFGKKVSSRAGAVESGAGRTGRQSGSANAKSYENLPSDAKAACDRYVKQKLMTKEEYVSSYDWS